MALRFRLRVFDVFGVERGHVYEWEQLQWTRVLNEVPTGSLAWNAGGERADLLAPPFEAAIEVETGGGWVELPNMRAVSTKVTRSGEGRDFLQADLVGVGHALSWATVWDAAGADSREFTTVSPGSMFSTLLAEAKARKGSNGLAWANGALSWSFTGGADSAGHAWGRNLRKAWNVSDDLLKVVSWLAEKGAADWQMRGRVLEMFVADTVLAPETDVRVREFASLAEPEVVSWQDLATTAKFGGDEGYTFVKDSPDSERAFGRIERWSQQGQVKLEATAGLYLDEILAAGKAAAVEYRAAWTPEAGHSPLLDYDLGSWVWLDAAGERVRVVENGFTVSPVKAEGFDTFGSRHRAYLERLARRTTDLSSGQVGSDSGAPSRAPGADERVPGPVAAPVVTAVQVVNAVGLAGSSIRVSWSAATADVNGAEAVPSGYEVALDTGSGWFTAWTDGTEFEASGPAEGVVRARVRPLSGQNKPGDWSDVTEVQIEALVQEVTAPRNVTVKSELGTLVVLWDGTVTGGGRPPASVQHMELEATMGTRTETTRVLQSAKRWPLPWPRLGESWRVRARLADTLGNVSAWVTVTPSPVTVDGVGGDDIVARSVTAAIGEYLSVNAGTIYGTAAEFTEAIVDNLKANRTVTNELWANLITGKKIKADMLDATYAEVGTLRVGGYTIDARALAGTVSRPVDLGGGTSFTQDGISFGNIFKVTSAGHVQTPRLEAGQNSWGYGRRSILTANESGVDQGVYFSDSGNAAGAAGVFRLGSTGNELVVRGGTNTGHSVRIMGSVRIPDHDTTTSTVNAWINSASGVIARSTSLRRFKQDIRDLVVDEDAYLSLPGRDWFDKNQVSENGGSTEGLHRIPGLVVEELLDLGLDRFVTFDDATGEPVGVAYDRAWVPLVGIVKQQKAQLAALEGRLSQLERQING